MTDRQALAAILALIWGALWALFLQLHPWGQWLALRRTWLTVVIGVGVDLALLLLILDAHTWATVVAIIAASSIGIIARSLYNEHADDAN
jgi:uncharacterized protein involved in cysteine biosynthesis